MKDWKKQLKYNPVKPLVSSNDTAISLLARKYLLEEDIQIERLWALAEPKRLFRKQNDNGSWKYPNPPDSNLDYVQYQTYLNLAILVEKYSLNRKHESVSKAFDYLLSFQTKEGDIRGIYGKQYTPNYTAAILEILIKAGYGKDKKVKKALRWLYSIRQNDGGWALPFRTKGHNLGSIHSGNKTIQPDKTKPSSHMATGMVLRAFALIPKYQKDSAIQQAGKILSNSLFSRDSYPDRTSSDFWYRFTYPFVYTDLLSALDSLLLLNFSPKHKKISQALDWFRDKQNREGDWSLKITRGKDKKLNELWLSLSIAKVFKGFYE